jgi:hypothetical protein
VPQSSTAPLSAWYRSSRCESASCVEVMATSEAMLIRDSKDPLGPVLSLSREQYTQFVSAVRSGIHDRI